MDLPGNFPLRETVTAPGKCRQNFNGDNDSTAAVIYGTSTIEIIRKNPARRAFCLIGNPIRQKTESDIIHVWLRFLYIYIVVFSKSDAGCLQIGHMKSDGSSSPS